MMRYPARQGGAIVPAAAAGAAPKYRGIVGDVSEFVKRHDGTACGVGGFRPDLRDNSTTTMKIVIAPDSFKECLPAAAVADALARGWRAARVGDTLAPVPMADGGEGTAAALAASAGGCLRELDATGPLGDPVRAAFALLPDGTAVVEVAAASGLARVPESRRDAPRACSRGTGELVRAALDAGARRLLLGLGGSATTDAGAGLARALGYRLLDAGGAALPPGGAALARLDRIDPTGADPRLRGLRVEAACDVDNPLCGPAGAAAVFGPQKGATPADVAALDAALARWAAVAARDLGVDTRNQPGGGAAGGLGAGAVAWLGATLRPGAALIAGAAGLDAALAGADLAITGEGQLDAQSLRGKAPVGVARAAAARGVPVVAVAGSVPLPEAAWRGAGFAAVWSLSDLAGSEAAAKANAPDALAAAGAEIARWFGARVSSTRPRSG